MFARLSRGWSMAKASFTVLRQYPKLAILPAVSGVIFLIVIAAILATLVPFGSGRTTSNAIWTALGDGNTGNIWFYLSAFGVFYVLASVAIFFNVALIHCALRAHAGEQPSIRAGLAAAVGLLPQILAWAAVATTVGIVLNMITDALKNYLGFLGGLLGGLLEFSWAVITYFVVPVLVTEKVGPITAVKRSASILRSKWGESLALSKTAMLPSASS
jgi:ABC-type multidrug transport system fused ATPase/permease subunit